MDIERTPPSGLHDDNSTDSRLTPLGRRHTPTARMSERKRNLFVKRQPTLSLITDQDDVDLGPMSPLQYSSSPTESLPFDRNAKQTDFSNLFPGSKMSLCASPGNSLKSPNFPADKPVLVVEESNSTAISVQAAAAVGGGGTPQQPTMTTEIAATENALEVTKSRITEEKTPSERMINCKELRVSFKKSLILGDLFTPSTADEQRAKNHQKRSYSTSVLAEKNCSASPKEKVAKLDAQVDASRARTSLTFEGISIPTNLFYGGQQQNDENNDPSPTTIRNKRYSLPILPSKSSSSHRRTSITGHQRRSRDGSGLARKGCSHKIKKPPRMPAKEVTRKKVEMAVLEDQSQKEQQEKEQMHIDEAQTSRIHEILKNIKNPLEMSRPLFFTDKEDRFLVTEDEDESPDGEEAEKSKRKFFKSRMTGAKSYKLTNNVVATVEGGRITLPKFASTIRSPDVALSSEVQSIPQSEFSMVEEEFGAEEFEEVTGIISKLTSDDEMDAFRSRLPYNTTDPQEAEKQQQLLELLISNQLCNEENFRIFIAEPEKHQQEMNRIMDSLVVVVGEGEDGKKAAQQQQQQLAPGLFPIFYQQNHSRPENKRKLIALGGSDGKSSSSASRKVWKRIGDAQLQIDAGQKRFGATYCSECDLLYSVHEPEDELMHERFHAALTVLKFAGWKAETVVREVPQWGVDGRVLAVAWNEHKAKVLRVNGVLEVMNREMGCPQVEWRSKTIVYVAVAQNTILGVCVAESKYEANRLVTENGVDFFSEENYPVWCGISRIWVAAPYRNQGVASQLVGAVRTHYTVGRTLGIDEVAFQSPTEAGKLLAQKLAGRRDFLVYP